MGTLGNPKVWIPYMRSKECTQERCSLSCPQWCYIIFPPPPPFAFPEDKSQNTQTFSPFVVAIIGILASAFLLAGYYAIISKYCGKNESSRDQLNQSPNDETLDDNEGNSYNNYDPSLQNHDPWYVSTHGLDEALIKTITLVKYKKGDGLIESGDCSVCLGEFVEDDTLRLLPKCSHAFHVACVDTWLKSHSNCPLCRANIFSITHPQPAQLPLTLVVEETDATNSNHHLQDHGSSSQNHVANMGISSISEGSGNLLQNPFRTFSDLGSSGLRKGSIHQYLNHARDVQNSMMRRSISMDHCSETQESVLNIVRLQDEEDCCLEDECQFHDDQCMKMGVGESSKSGLGDASSTCCKNGVLHSVMNSVALKRSSLFSKHSRGSSAVTPV